MFFLNSVSPTIRSEQFLLTLSATEYGMFFATFGGVKILGKGIHASLLAPNIFLELKTHSSDVVCYQEKQAQFHCAQV